MGARATRRSLLRIIPLSEPQSARWGIASVKWRFEIRSAPQFGLLLVGEMLFKTFSAAVFGIDAYLVEVEVDVGPGHSGDFNVVGLPDIAVKESRERIKSALRNCGFDFRFCTRIWRDPHFRLLSEER
jgi:Subunit ChlI of Mg-chelatase